MSLTYNIALDSEGNSTITMVSDGLVSTVDASHPNYVRIATALVDGEDPHEIMDLLADAIDELDGFSLGEDDDEIYWGDGDDRELVDSSVRSTFSRYVAEGRDTTNLPKFMARVAKNPSFRAREQLWTWLGVQGLTIDAEGYIIAFKGLSSDTSEPGVFKSVHSGRALVDGVEQNGQIEQKVGSIVSMPRDMVSDDGNISCSYGLHIGTWQYASSFADTTVEVRVDPADVVSVPSGNETWKLRCCQYTVLAVHAKEQGNDLTSYEPEGTYTPDHLVETLASQVPSGFLEKLRARLGRKGEDA